MPIVIIVIAIAVLGAGAFFLTKEGEPMPESNEPATEELIENTDGKMEEEKDNLSIFYFLASYYFFKGT